MLTPQRVRITHPDSCSGEFHQRKAQIHNEVPISIIILDDGRYHPRFKCRESCPPEAIRSDQEINQIEQVSGTTAVRTFESDDQTSCRILMSRKFTLARYIRAQSKQLATYILM